MPLWSMDDWQYVERQVVTDPKGRQWSIALMDVLGQAEDPEVPSSLVELQYAAFGRRVPSSERSAETRPRTGR